MEILMTWWLFLIKAFKIYKTPENKKGVLHFHMQVCKGSYKNVAWNKNLDLSFHLDPVQHGNVTLKWLLFSLQRLWLQGSDHEPSTRVSCLLFCLINTECTLMAGRHDNSERVEGKSTFAHPVTLPDCRLVQWESQTPPRLPTWAAQSFTV